MPASAFILIVSADDAKAQQLRDVLREKHRQRCGVAGTLDEALDSIRRRSPDLVVTDMRVGDSEAVAPLGALLDSLAPDATLIAVGEPVDKPVLAHIELVTLPINTEFDQLLQKTVEAAARAVDRRQSRLFAESFDTAIEVFEGIVGSTPQIRRIVERIRKAARNKLTVLILGETGTGKELIAEAIHRQSDRARKPLKSLNCAGLNENLLESELFGHVKGAFTGAIADRKGYFAAADGGTLFLDEIGDTPLTMQAKLLRALERREITPVGSTEVQRVDVRVIAATNSDLRKAVEERKFREDLYYRLKQWEIQVPPLRERRQDIPLLALHFLKRANETHRLHVSGIAPEAMMYLARYYWPGNVRELANLIEALAVEAEDRRIEPEDLPESIRGSRDIVHVAPGSMIGLTMAQVERLMIERTLQSTGGNREQAAKMLGIGTRTLYRKIKEYELP